MNKSKIIEKGIVKLLEDGSYYVSGWHLDSTELDEEKLEVIDQCNPYIFGGYTLADLLKIVQEDEI